MSRSRNSRKGIRGAHAGKEFWASRLLNGGGDGCKRETHRMERKDGKRLMDNILNRHRMVPLEEQWQ